MQNRTGVRSWGLVTWGQGRSFDVVKTITKEGFVPLHLWSWCISHEIGLHGDGLTVMRTVFRTSVLSKKLMGSTVVTVDRTRVSPSSPWQLVTWAWRSMCSGYGLHRCTFFEPLPTPRWSRERMVLKFRSSGSNHKEDKFGSPLTRSAQFWCPSPSLTRHFYVSLVLFWGYFDVGFLSWFFLKGEKNSFGLGKEYSVFRNFFFNFFCPFPSLVNPPFTPRDERGTERGKKIDFFFTSRVVVQWIDCTTAREVYVQSRTTSLIWDIVEWSLPHERKNN